MPSRSADLVWRLIAKADTRGFKETSNAAEKTGKDIHKSIGTGAIAAGSMIGSLAASGVTALVGLAAAGVSTGVQTAASLEQAQIGFTQLIGSGTKAEAFLSDLSDFAASTPFEMNGLIDSSRTLLGVGVAAKDVIPTLTAFGDAAGAVGIQGDAFQRIMLATSQAISAGKFQTADLNQIMNNGLPVWTILSKALGKPVAALRDMASKGKLLAKDVMPALKKQMEKDYGGAMAKQSQTLSGLWSTLSDTLTQGMAKVLVPLLPTLKNLATQGIAFLGKAFQWLAAEGPKLAAGIKVVADFISNVWWPALKTIWGWISTTAIPFLKNLADAFMKNVWPAIVNVAQMIATNLQPVIESLSDLWRNTLLPGIKDLIPILQTVGRWVGVVAGALLVAASWIIGKVAPILINVLGGAIRFVIAVLGKVVDAIQWVIDNWQGFLDFVKDIPNKIKSLFGGLVGVIVSPFRTAFNAIAAAWNNTVGKLQVHTPDIPGTSWGGLDLAMPKIPYLASGGIVTRPTLAVVGDGGPEAVVPLSRGGYGGAPIIVHVHNAVVGNERQVEAVVLKALQRAKGRSVSLGLA